jgi:single-strand DNA-binding protein
MILLIFSQLKTTRMVQIFGRLTKDAEVKAIEDGKEVVNFTIAVNDWYKPKGATEGTELVEFIQCSYWLNATIAQTLKKGAVVEAGGRLFATAYMKGSEPKGQINMLAQHIKVHVFAKKEESAATHDAAPAAQPASPQGKRNGKGKTNTQKPGQQSTTGPTDDLPF